MCVFNVNTLQNKKKSDPAIPYKGLQGTCISIDDNDSNNGNNFH